MIMAARKRRLGILALAAVIGSTGGARRRAVTAADLVLPLTTAIRLPRQIGDLAAGLSAAASHVASFGILSATVMAGMEPETRRSILAALEGWRGSGAVDAPRPLPVVSRCSVKHAPKTVHRCSRA